MKRANDTLESHARLLILYKQPRVNTLEAPLIFPPCHVFRRFSLGQTKRVELVVPGHVIGLEQEEFIGNEGVLPRELHTTRLCDEDCRAEQAPEQGGDLLEVVDGGTRRAGTAEVTLHARARTSTALHPFLVIFPRCSVLFFLNGFFA